MIESCITFLPVQDLDATTRFYTEIIGLALYRNFGSCRIFSCGEGYFGFCRYGDGRQAPKGVCLSLNLADTCEVDARYTQLLKSGFTPDTAPHRHPDFPVYSFFCSDPDGYCVEFQKILV